MSKAPHKRRGYLKAAVSLKIVLNEKEKIREPPHISSSQVVVANPVL